MSSQLLHFYEPDIVGTTKSIRGKQRLKYWCALHGSANCKKKPNSLVCIKNVVNINLCLDVLIGMKLKYLGKKDSIAFGKINSRSTA